MGKAVEGSHLPVEAAAVVVVFAQVAEVQCETYEPGTWRHPGRPQFSHSKTRAEAVVSCLFSLHCVDQ